MSTSDSSLQAPADTNENELEDVVGKEIASKIVNGEGKKFRGNPYTHLEGLDLKVGGEGMKGFYDKIPHRFQTQISHHARCSTLQRPCEYTHRIGC